MIKKIALNIILFASIGAFLLAAFVLYHEYNGYQARVKKYAKTIPQAVTKTNPNALSIKEVDVLESYRYQRNILLGYENFLMESALHYTPSEFSYPNLLKEKFITQLDNIKYTQPYWDAIITNFFTDTHSENNTPLVGYDAIMKIPSTYVDEDLEGMEDIEEIEQISTEVYWKRKVFYMNRTSQHIDKIWQQNKAFFYTYLSKSKYDKHCKNVISDLVEIHVKITQEPNYKSFYNTYNVSDSIFHTFPSIEYVKSFEYSWPFSFWDRRFQEQNDKIIIEILKEIQNHYEN